MRGRRCHRPLAWRPRPPPCWLTRACLSRCPAPRPLPPTQPHQTPKRGAVVAAVCCSLHPGELGVCMRVCSAVSACDSCSVALPLLLLSWSRLPHSEGAWPAAASDAAPLSDPDQVRRFCLAPGPAHANPGNVLTVITTSTRVHSPPVRRNASG